MLLVRCATAGRKPRLVMHVAIMLRRVSNLPLAAHHLSARAWHASIFLHTIFAFTFAHSAYSLQFTERLQVVPQCYHCPTSVGALARS